MSITVTAPDNIPPSVEAGPGQTVQGGSKVSLSGNATDSDGDVLAYLWTHNSNALNITLANATSASTTFTAPPVDSDTDIIFTLTADDGAEARSDTVTVTVTDVQSNYTQTSFVVLEPEEPRDTRDIGRIILNSTLPGAIDATWDAPAEAPVDYRLSWAKVGDPFRTWTDLSGNAFPTDASHTITGLDENEAYKVIVRARYGGSAGAWSGEITITVAGSANSSPTADAGTTQTIQEGNAVTLNGTASDPDGDQLTYSWSHDSALEISLADAGSLSPTFTAPQVDANTTVTFTLTADDGTDTHSDTVTVTIQDIQADDSPTSSLPPTTPVVLEPETPPGPRDIGRITLTSGTPGAIEVSWASPSETPIDYRISWAKTGESFRTWTDMTGNAFPTDPSHTISDLEEGEEYKMKVRARYGGSAGDWSGEIIITVARTG